MISNKWTNNNLDNCLTYPFSRLKIEEITKACHNFKEDYIQNKNNRSGYYLLWLIKQATRHKFEMPNIDLFNEKTASKIVSQIFNNYRRIPQTMDFTTSKNLFDNSDQSYQTGSDLEEVFIVRSQ